MLKATPKAARIEGPALDTKNILARHIEAIEEDDAYPQEPLDRYYNTAGRNQAASGGVKHRRNHTVDLK